MYTCYTYGMLEAVALHKRFRDVPALEGFDLAVAAGEIVGLVGHNGAGKTTFARSVAGLVRPDRGTIRVAGRDVAREPREARARLGLAPQELALYPTATARENLLLFAGLHGLRRKESKRRVDEVAEALVLVDVLDRKIRELSGGQQRRVQAASAIVHRPPVLLLDEPTVGADPTTRDALLSTLRSLAGDGAAIVYTTHYLSELDALEATLAVADHGRIIARGERAKLLSGVPGHAILEFDRSAASLDPPVMTSAEIFTRGAEMTIRAIDPAAIVAALLAAYPEAASQLRAIQVHAPTLDDLYRGLVAHHGR